MVDALYFFLCRWFSLKKIAFLFFLIAPFLNFSIYPFHNQIKTIIGHVFFIVLFGGLIVSKIINLDFRFKVNQAFILFNVLIISLPVSILLAPVPHIYSSQFGIASMSSVFITLEIWGTYFCCYQILTYRDVGRLVRAFYSSYVIALIGMIYNIYFPSHPGSIFRIASLMHDPNIFGLYLLMVALIAWIYLSRKFSPIHIVVLISALLLLVLTYSRSAMFFSLIFIPVAYFLVPIKIRKELMIVSLVLILALAGVFINSRLSKEARHLNMSNYSRLSTNIATVNLLKDRFPFGVGYSNARYYLRKYQDTEYPIMDIVVVTHNVYIAILAELGLWGIVIYFSFYLTCLWYLLRLYKRGNQETKHLSFLVISFILIYLMFHLLYYYEFFHHLYYNVVLLALLLSGARYDSHLSMSNKSVQNVIPI
ncbi:MAG: O-antigen ligase family protein [Fibrobacteres bacterium]|nr:O-antigen ligase family protein [Fibrobacterota bacterium]